MFQATLIVNRVSWTLRISGGCVWREQKRRRFNATIDPRVWEDAPIDPTKDVDEQMVKLDENQRIQKQLVMAKVTEIKAEMKTKARTKPRRSPGEVE